MDYDNSIPALLSLLEKNFGLKYTEAVVVIRDSIGHLSAVFDIDVPDGVLQVMTAQITELLGPYARPDRVVGGSQSPGSDYILAEALRISPVDINGTLVRVIDRRIVGADWLRPPVFKPTKIPRIVFGSLKGGVGRSTALCVVASHLSRRGMRVLAIDFDLEAPGIGSMLLSEDELPQYGTLDYLVEIGLGNANSNVTANIGGDSYLGAEGGRVTVVPAIGKSTYDNPENALGKISRAYLETTLDDGTIIGLPEKLDLLIQSFEETDGYDIVLVDARAGLHETTAGAILSLSADVLLFGVDQPQTYLGYRLLMGHLKRFISTDNGRWIERMTFVHAKSSNGAEKQTQATERFSELFELIIPQSKNEDIIQLTSDDFSFDWDDSKNLSELDEIPIAPNVVRVLDDTRYTDFNPILERSLLNSEIYNATFGSLLKYVDTIIEGGLEGIE